MMLSSIVLLAALSSVGAVHFIKPHHVSVEAYSGPLFMAQSTYQAPYQPPIIRESGATKGGVKGGELKYETKNRAPLPQPAYLPSYQAPQPLAYLLMRPAHYAAAPALYSQPALSQPSLVPPTKGAVLQKEVTVAAGPVAVKTGKLAGLKDAIDRLALAAMSKVAFSNYYVEKEEILAPPAPVAQGPVQEQLKEQQIDQELEPQQQVQEQIKAEPIQQQDVKGRELPAVQQLEVQQPKLEVKGRDIAPIPQQEIEQQRQETKSSELQPVQQLEVQQQRAQEVKGKELLPLPQQEIHQQKQEVKGRELPPVQQQQQQQHEDIKGLQQSQEALPIRQETKGKERPQVQQELNEVKELPQVQQELREVKGKEVPLQDHIQREVKSKEVPLMQQLQREVKGQELTQIQQQEKEIQQPELLEQKQEIKGKGLFPAQQHQQEDIQAPREETGARDQQLQGAQEEIVREEHSPQQPLDLKRYQAPSLEQQRLARGREVIPNLGQQLQQPLAEPTREEALTPLKSEPRDQLQSNSPNSAQEPKELEATSSQEESSLRDVPSQVHPVHKLKENHEGVRLEHPTPALEHPRGLGREFGVRRPYRGYRPANDDGFVRSS